VPPRDLPPFAAWPDGEPAHLPAWANVFLQHYAVNGGLELAANEARVHRGTVHKLRQAVPAFDDACGRAAEYYDDSLEWYLVEQAHKTGIPLGFFGRLKADRPQRWLDRQLIASLEVKTEIPADQITDFLGSLVAHTTPTTRQLLGLPTPVDNSADPKPTGEPIGGG